VFLQKFTYKDQDYWCSRMHKPYKNPYNWLTKPIR